MTRASILFCGRFLLEIEIANVRLFMHRCAVSRELFVLGLVPERHVGFHDAVDQFALLFLAMGAENREQQQTKPQNLVHSRREWRPLVALAIRNSPNPIDSGGSPNRALVALQIRSWRFGESPLPFAINNLPER